ncbi:MAG: hypothetical protein AAF081_12475 [Actinomycetota bacterium]
MLLVAAPLGAPVAGAHAQETAPGQLTIIDARLTGDGPWTSWFGGAAERRLLLVFENSGDVAIDAPELVLRIGKGEATTPLEAPELAPLDPGDRRTVQVPVELDPFAFGTHAVVGEFLGVADTPGFRAETTHVPWLLLLLPTLVLAQVALVGLRNRTRRRLAPTPAEPTVRPTIDLREPPTRATGGALDETTVRRAVERELDRALADLMPRIDAADRAERIERRAALATERVARRLDLDDAERPRLAAEITRALLAAIDAATLTTT